MTISDSIRALAREGVQTSEIARRLGIRYQHAYNVLARSEPSRLPAGEVSPARSSVGRSISPKPQLSLKELIAGGFTLSGRWILSPAGELELDRPLPKDIGVYAFAKAEVVLYVGVATMGLAKRLYFYRKPGVTQRTSQRLNAIIRNELSTTEYIEIYTAIPPDHEWNGLPIHGSAGLELGLIKKYTLPWNMRSAG